MHVLRQLCPGYMMAFGSGDGNVGSSLLSRDDVNETAVAELRRLFESLDEEHGRTKGQLDSLNARVQEDALALQVTCEVTCSQPRSPSSLHEERFLGF